MLVHTHPAGPFESGEFCGVIAGTNGIAVAGEVAPRSLSCLAARLLSIEVQQWPLTLLLIANCAWAWRVVARAHSSAKYIRSRLAWTIGRRWWPERSRQTLRSRKLPPPIMTSLPI